MVSSGLRVALLVVDGFVALTAIGGGIALATGLEGDRFPADWLKGTPFSSYLVPGLILAVMVGGSAAAATAAALSRPDAGGLTSLAAGLIMMGWIAGEIMILKQPSWSWTEVFYFAVGFVMAALGLALQRVAGTPVS